MSDSLLFALRKFKQAPEPLRATVVADVGRNPEGRLRVLGIDATPCIWVCQPIAWNIWTACSARSESYCTVTQSVGQGIPIAEGAGRPGRGAEMTWTPPLSCLFLRF